MIYPQNIEALHNARENKTSTDETEVARDIAETEKPAKKKTSPIDIFVEQDGFVFNNHYKERIEIQQKSIEEKLPDINVEARARGIAPTNPKTEKVKKEVQKVKNRIPEQITRLLGATSIFIMAGAVLNIYMTNTRQSLMMNDTQIAHIYLFSMIVIASFAINIKDTIIYKWLSKRKVITSKPTKQRASWSLTLLLFWDYQNSIPTTSLLCLFWFSV